MGKIIIDTPESLLEFLEDCNYKEFDRLMSPKEVFNLQEGSCHDQTMFELAALAKMDIISFGVFLMAVDNEGNGGETHSFVFYRIDDKVFWLENAWEDHRGIHQFDSEGDLLEYIIDEFRQRNPDMIIYLADFISEEHTPGENLQTLVDICMERAIEV